MRTHGRNLACFLFSCNTSSTQHFPLQVKKFDFLWWSEYPRKNTASIIVSEFIGNCKTLFVSTFFPLTTQWEKCCLSGSGIFTVISILSKYHPRYPGFVGYPSMSNVIPCTNGAIHLSPGCNPGLIWHRPFRASGELNSPTRKGGSWACWSLREFIGPLCAKSRLRGVGGCSEEYTYPCEEGWAGRLFFGIYDDK